MACFGSKTIKSRRPQSQNSVEVSQMAGKDHSSVQSGRKHEKSRKPQRGHHGMDRDQPRGKASKVAPDKHMRAQNSSKSQTVPQKPVIRRTIDPETTKYFSEIANLFEGGTIDLEQRSAICGNALEETRGKELELATDKIISHVLQTLLEGCDVEELCSFLLSCAEEFPHIATDKSGSHVAETALKSLAVHLQDSETYAAIEVALTKICQVVVENSIDVMCSIYGSHVLRSLLCLCKGIPLDSLKEFHSTNSSTILAERLNSRLPQSGGSDLANLQQGFPHLLKFLVREMLNHAKDDIAALRVNKYSTFVLQTALKLLVGDDQELLHVIPIILGCHSGSTAEAKFIEATTVHEIKDLLKDTAYSHLMEVILEVAPETLYNQVLAEIFRGSLFEISSDHCGSFVVQALVSSAKSKVQMDLIWAELGPRTKELLEIGKTGVVASLLAACQRVHACQHECSRALAAAVSSGTQSPRCIVPRMLFLESYFSCEEKSSWKWAKGDKMHTLGCLMLQTIFKYSSELIQPFLTSVTSIEADLVFETAKDAGGSRVVEAFLSSDASAKQKQKVIAKLWGHFGGLSMHPSGSFTVEKCFNAGNVSLKEAIASELVAVQSELSKTKQGPYLLKKLDVDGFATRPEQWRTRLASKQTAYCEFFATFGSETKPQKGSFSRPPPPQVSSQKTLKQMRKEIDQCLTSSQSTAFSGSEFSGLESSMKRLGFSSFKHPKREDVVGKTGNGGYAASKRKQGKGNEKNPVTGNTTRPNLQKLPGSANRNEKKRSQADDLLTPRKKQKK